MIILSICDEPSLMNVIRIIMLIIKIVIVAVPIVLIMSLMIRFLSAMTKHDENEIRKVMKTAIPNVIAAVLIFLVPTLVDIVVKVSFPNSEYTKCISDISVSKVTESYNSKMDKLISTAEKSLKYSDYSIALSYLVNIKDANDREKFANRLDIVKEKIDESSIDVNPDNPNPQVTSNDYSKVNYSNFKWSKYNQKSGPALKYYSEMVPYAIYAPEKVSDLNGVSLPLIVWLHGAGQLGVEGGTINEVVTSELPRTFTNWSKYNLDPFPALVVAPQHILKRENGWGQTRNIETIKALIKYMKEEYSIDTSKVILMGHSYGGNGAYTVANEMKEYYYAVVTTSSTRSDPMGCDKEYFSKLKIRGYSEFGENEEIFKWMGQKDAFIKVNAQHSEVPIIALTQDNNKNNISDLSEWLFGEKAKIK